MSAELRPSLYTSEFQRLADSDPLNDYASTLLDAPSWLTPLEQQLHMDTSFHCRMTCW
ncbi:MAG: hypothetical protein R3C19_22235 [Planctomycetaceae bacterium]